MDTQMNNQITIAEDIETIDDNIKFNYKSIENPSPNQDYKLNLDFILHKPNAPFYLFGGIFGSFGIDKLTGQKYYNYLDLVKHQQQQQQQQQQQLQSEQLNKEIITINALNHLLLRKIN